MKLRQDHPLEIAAAKAGLSRAMGYRIVQDPRLPSQKDQLRARRRPDPLEHIFDAEVVPLLQAAPGLRAVAVYEEMLRRHLELQPGRMRALCRPSPVLTHDLRNSSSYYLDSEGQSFLSSRSDA